MERPSLAYLQETHCKKTEPVRENFVLICKSNSGQTRLKTNNNADKFSAIMIFLINTQELCSC